MLGNRGQQLGEYGILVGTVAMAAIAMQMYVSRAVAGALKGSSEAMLGTAHPDNQNTTHSQNAVDATGAAGSVQTTITSSVSGASGSGFILAEAFGPNPITSLDPETVQSELQLLASMLQIGDQLVDARTTPSLSKHAVQQRREDVPMMISWLVVR